MGDKKCTARVNLSETERENLLNRLEQQSRGASASGLAKSNRRRHKRWNFRDANATVSVEHPAGGISKFLVYTRDISASGLGFVHGGYLHEGSTCQVLLRTLDRKSRTVRGTIVSCRHLEGIMHLTGVQFERRIDPAIFVDTSISEPTPSEALGLRELKGSILYIDDSIDDRDLMKFVLEACDAQVHVMTNGIEGLCIFEQKRFDVVLTELSLPGVSGLEIVGIMRAGGFTGPIVGLTADESPQVRDYAIANGCSEVLIKPVDVEFMTNLLSQMMVRPEKPCTDLTPLFSSRWKDVRMRPLILQFLGRLDGQVRQIQQYLDTSDSQSVQRLCLAVKGSAGGYGFPDLSAAAENVRRQLASEGMDVEAVKESMQALANMCAAACLVRDEETDDR